MTKDGNSYIVAGMGSCTDTDIVIPAEHEGKPVTSIGDTAFSCRTGLTSITLPDSVTEIGYSAFSGCSGLTSITLGNGVTEIAHSAFKGCSNLTNITFKGTQAQWKAIYKGNVWKYNTGSFSVRCTDGDIPKSQA